MYNDSDPLFQMRKYIRWADEHVLMWELAQNSDVISWEVKETDTKLNIPKVYTVEYRIRSIIGIDENQDPIYSDHHILELGIPTAYPLHPCTLYMQTNAWHPNIQSGGQYKGRVCGNVKDFGLNYSLPELVLRVGEILQYKNYLAEFIPPYPEDVEVAKWVREVAEPRGIVDLRRQIFVDNTPLLRLSQNEPGSQPAPAEIPAAVADPQPAPAEIGGADPSIITPSSSEDNPTQTYPTPQETPGDTPVPRIRILTKNNPTPPTTREKIVIKPKGN